MISLFDAKDIPERLAITYNGLTLNSPTDTNEDCYQINFVVPHTTFASIQDEKPTGDGIEIYESWKRSKAIRLIGRVASSTRPGLFDRVEALAKAFDPALATFSNASTFGFLPLDFSTLTADTTNYSTGIIACRYYARAISGIETLPSAFSGNSYFFTLDLQMRDPRRYLQTTNSQTGAGTISNIGDYPSPATVTITMSGAGSSTYAIENNATVNDTTLTLDLSGCASSDVVVVDMEAKTITKNGSDAMSLYVSGDYFLIEPGDNVITLSNTTNSSTVTSYRRAFAL